MSHERILAFAVRLCARIRGLCVVLVAALGVLLALGCPIPLPRRLAPSELRGVMILRVCGLLLFLLGLRHVRISSKAHRALMSLLALAVNHGAHSWEDPAAN